MRNCRDTDFCVKGGGTVFMVAPVSDAAKEWVRENVRLESYQWLGNAFGVEHRYVRDLLDGVRADGLTVSYSDKALYGAVHAEV